MFFCFSKLCISALLWAPHETHGSCLLPVNSFGDDEEPCTSSDSDGEVIKQFEISMSRSQSFRSEASKKGTQVGLEQKSKFSHLLSTHEEDNTEVSACEGICMKPSLYLEQGWTIVRTALSHLITTLVSESPERKRKGGETQRLKQSRGGLTNLTEGLSCRELGGMNKKCQNPYP